VAACNVRGQGRAIENEQREGLRPLELALFVQKRIALGDNQVEIVKRLGKSRQWVTLATPSDWIPHAYREGCERPVRPS
jgi:ParB family transcriptional regulator, chromosome partitioning protein